MVDTSPTKGRGSGIPAGSYGYTEDDFGSPRGAQDRVFLEGSAVVSRDEGGHRFEVLTDAPRSSDVPIKVREDEFMEKTLDRSRNRGGSTSGSGSSGSGSSGSGSSGSGSSGSGGSGS